MPLTTRVFAQIPWDGGVNTSLEESLISPNQLREGANIIQAERSSKKKRDGINFNFDDATATTDILLKISDTHLGTSGTKTQRYVGISDSRDVYEYTTSGARTTLTVDGSATAWTGTPAIAGVEIIQNKVILTTDTTTDTVHKWTGTGTSIFDLGSNAEITSCVCVADVSDSLDGTFFTLFDDVGSVAFWYDVDDSGTTIPTGAAAADRAIEITTIVTNDSASTVASATSTVINADSKFSTSVSTATITITSSTDGFKFAPNAGTTGFTVTVTTKGHDAVPKASFARKHIGRLWMNDKDDVDLLHYSTTSDCEEFQGRGDSGALRIGSGDGDKEGITAIFPSFNGVLIVAKRTRLYEVSGFFPETFSIRLITDSIGCVNHNAVAATDNDIVFVSTRGVHSIIATNKFGNLDKTFLSGDIQKTFNDDFDLTRLDKVQASYLPRINSVCFCFTQSKVNSEILFPSSTSSGKNNSGWFFNITKGQWYRGFDSLPCDSIMTADDSDKDRFYLGGFNNRLIKTDIGSSNDTNFAGTSVSVFYKISSARIFPDGQIYTMKAFKRFAPIFASPGIFTVSIMIDNLPTQTLQYSEFGDADQLDVDFILDQSTLGADSVLSPFARTIDGLGRSIQFDIEHNQSGETVEIQGFLVEFEDAGVNYEVRT